MEENMLLTRKKARAETVRSMKKLGVYKKEFDTVIDIYAELLEQYAALTDRYEQGGRQCVALTADGGEKKAPLVATLECLRKDLLQYSDRLMLNPKAHATQQKGAGANSTPSLTEVLKDLGG